MNEFPPELLALPPKRQRFVLEYLSDHNGTQAAIRAGYAPASANMQAARMLAIDNVKAAVEALEEPIMQRILGQYEVSVERVLQELSRLAFHDLRKLYNEDGSLKPPKEWDDDTAAAVAGLEIFEEFSGQGKEREKIGETKKVKVWDKKGALELLGKTLKMFTEEVNHTGSIIVEIVKFGDENKNPKPLVTEILPAPKLEISGGGR